MTVSRPWSNQDSERPSLKTSLSKCCIGATRQRQPTTRNTSQQRPRTHKQSCLKSLSIWLCCQYVAVLKVKNVSRHYTTKHKDFGNDLSEVERQVKATELSRKLIMQQNVLIQGKLAQEASTHASYTQWAGTRTLTILVTKQLDQNFYLVVQSWVSSFKNWVWFFSALSILKVM